jgi:glycosyltransferase involved in cell wall biosynthesis
MRIAMMSEHASPLAVLGGVDAGGQNVHVAALATALADRGHEVVVYTRRDSADLPERVPLARGVDVVHLDAGPPFGVAKDDLAQYVPDMGLALRDQLIADPPDVLHAHFWMSGLAGLVARLDVDVPLLMTFHALGVVKRREQGVADTSPRGRVRSERMLARRATRVIASSTDERRELLRLGASPGCVDVVPSGVDLDLFCPAADGGDAAGRALARRVVAVSRLVPRKGLDDAIRAVALLPGDVEFVVAGGPPAQQLDGDPEAQRLRALAGSLGVGDRVRLHGSVGHEEIPELLRTATVAVCVPWYEPFGIVPLEAMACGTPVVASAVGGQLDTVVPEATGLHVPPRDPAAVAAALARILDDPELRERFSAAGVQRAARYRWAEIAARTERSYRAAMASAGARLDETAAAGVAG